MNQLTSLPSPSVAPPAMIAAADDRSQLRFVEFFAVTIRNPHTRRAYGRAIGEFLGNCSLFGVSSLTAVQPPHFATWFDQLSQEVSVPIVKLRLAAVPHQVDW